MKGITYKITFKRALRAQYTFSKQKKQSTFFFIQKVSFSGYGKEKPAKCV